MLTYTPAPQPALDAFNSKRLSTNQKGVNAPDPNRPKEVLRLLIWKASNMSDRSKIRFGFGLC